MNLLKKYLIAGEKKKKNLPGFEKQQAEEKKMYRNSHYKVKVKTLHCII